MKMRQVDLQCEDRHMTCWIPAWIKKGDRIRFEGEGIFWDVKNVYEFIIEYENW